MNRIQQVLLVLLLCAGFAGCAGTDLSESKVEIPDNVGKWLKKELRSAQHKKVWNGNPETFFREGNARVVGYIAGYDTLMGFRTGVVYVSNELTREEYPKVIEIGPDGRFEVDIPLLYPSNLQLNISKTWVPVYVEPGHTLAVVLTRDDLPEDKYNREPVPEYYGAAARLNRELASYRVEIPLWGEFSTQYATMAPEEYKAHYIERWDGQLADFDKYAGETELLSETQNIIRAEIGVVNTQYIYEYLLYRKVSDNALEKTDVPAGYYDFMQRLDMDDPTVLIPHSSSVLLNRFEYADPFNAAHISAKYESFLEYLTENAGVVLTKEDEPFKAIMAESDRMKKAGAGFDKVLDFLNSPENVRINKSFYGRYGKEHAEYRAYINELHNRDRVEIQLSQWRAKDSILVNVMGLQPSLLYDIAKTRSLRPLFSIDIPAEDAAKYAAAMKEQVSCDFLKHQIDVCFDEMFSSGPEELPDTPAGRVFREIIEPFRGKVLLVDFWGVYCGPCIQGIEQNIDLRREYADSKDFAFLFITSKEWSPLDLYEDIVAKNELAHSFRIPGDDYLRLKELFRFNGIPKYVLIDSQCRIAKRDLNPSQSRVLINGYIDKY